MQTLEAINLFLAGELRNCIFVLGIEPAMLASHIEARHGELLKTLREREPLLATEDLSWRFLEKLLQLSVRLPEPPADVIGTYVGTLLEADTRVEVAPTDPASREEQERGRPADGPAPVARPRGDRTAEPADPSSDGEALHEASLTDERRWPDEDRLQSGPIAPDIARQAKRARARSTVKRKLRLDDPRVRAILAEAAAEVDGNPRALKRLVNLFVFMSYVAVERALFTASSQDAAVLTDLRRLSHACVLLIRWPHLVERLAKRPTADVQTSAGGVRPTVLELLASASDDGDWDQLVTRHGLDRRPAGEASDQPALPDLRQFISSHRDSIPLVAKLI
jgi:hypothetical protein